YLYVLHPSSPMHSSTLSLHDALPIYLARQLVGSDGGAGPDRAVGGAESSGRRAAAHGNRALIWRRAGGHLRKALSEDHACRRSLVGALADGPSVRVAARDRRAPAGSTRP